MERLLNVEERSLQLLGLHRLRDSGREHPQHIVPHSQLDRFRDGCHRNEREHFCVGRELGGIGRDRPVDLGRGAAFEEELRHARLGVGVLPDIVAHAVQFVITRTPLWQAQLGGEMSRLVHGDQRVLRPVNQPQRNLPQRLDIFSHVTSRDGQHHLPAGGVMGRDSCRSESPH